MVQSIGIDLIEETIAVCQEEDGTRWEIPVNLLPQGAKEGDWLLFDGKDYIPDPQQTKRKREAAVNLFHRLKKGGRSHG